MSPRPQEQIDHILKFRCGFCGSEPGRVCYQRRRGSSYRKPMGDFHMTRTQTAYPRDYAAGESDK